MRNFNYQLKVLCKRNRDGSFSGKATRERILTLIANELYELGFFNLHVTGLKPKHVEALVANWIARNRKSGTIKNRMTALRWWAEKIGKQNVIAKSNDSYGIADRKYVSNINKSRVVTEGDLSKVTNPFTRMSLRLQQEYGLRREEAHKIRPRWADRGDRLVLKDSWAKGRRAREIPIRTQAQRQIIEEAKQLAGNGSLIPRDKSYKQQLEIYKSQCALANINQAHGLRHFYAQARYLELTGWECPARGGPTTKELTKEQKQIDRKARLQISIELGHEREQITAIYLGR